MKDWKFRQKLCIILILLSAVVSILIWLLPIDPVLTGYRVVNGIESMNYVPKKDVILSFITVPLIVCLVWNYLAERMDKRKLENSEMVSYRIWGVAMDFLFLLFVLLPIAFGIANILIYLKN